MDENLGNLYDMDANTKVTYLCIDNVCIKVIRVCDFRLVSPALVQPNPQASYNFVVMIHWRSTALVHHTDPVVVYQHCGIGMVHECRTAGTPSSCHS